MPSSQHQAVLPLSSTQTPQTKSSNSQIFPYLIMQFNLLSVTTFALALAASTPAAFGASCYLAKGCYNCETLDSVRKAFRQLCASDFSHSKLLEWGDATLTLTGSFFNQDQCLMAGDNIVDQCYGKEDGGVYTYSYNGHDARLDIHFCDCPTQGPIQSATIGGTGA
ncbi:hypothetical protein C2E23DRAFT_845277 [Lenzites betulinus]|nr:hypothetical protein C2E23DRAFT_845277 [Lenzites betulinus]